MATKTKLNEAQKNLLVTLRRNPGSFLKKTINHAGTEKYKIYDSKLNPIAWANKTDVVHLSEINLVTWHQDGTIHLNDEQYNKFYKLTNRK